MLSLVCVVVNDGSVVVAEMEDNHVVCKLKKTIKEKKLYDFPADELALFMAKTDDGEWMHLSDDDLAKLQKREKIDAVEALLTKRPMNSASRLDNESFGFGADGAGEDRAVHVLVDVSAERWEEVRSAKRAKKSASSLEFTLKTGSVFVPTGVAEGTLQSTKDLSTAFQDFGGFPATMFVRPEMQMVWTILCDNFVGDSAPGAHYALVGSPGVDKSALLVLFCCHLAVHEGFNIFLARSVDNENGSTSGDVVLWFRGNQVTGYQKCHVRHLSLLLERFEVEHAGSKDLIICDGYVQAHLWTELRFFKSCHLLSTSGQFIPKSGDKRRLLLLPAWRRDQLQALATAMEIEDFDLRYAYSGGSARELLWDLHELKQRLFRTLSGLEKVVEKVVALHGNYGAPTNSSLDSIQRLFTTDVADTAGYLDNSTWQRIVDTPAALKHLASRVDLTTVSSMLQFTKTIGNGSLRGQVFEVLVHKLAHDRSLELDLREGSKDNSIAVKMAADCAVTTGNGSNSFSTASEAQKWADCLTFLREEATTKMYWIPDYLRVPAIDSVLVLDRVVYYLQMTVAEDHDVKWDKMREIHEAVSANTALSSHTFKFVMVTPRKTEWGIFKDQTSEIPASSGLPVLSMCEAQVNAKFD